LVEGDLAKKLALLLVVLVKNVDGEGVVVDKFAANEAGVLALLLFQHSFELFRRALKNRHFTN